MLTVERVLVTRMHITDDEYLVKKGGSAILRIGLALFDMITQEYYVWIEIIHEGLLMENLRGLIRLASKLPKNCFCCVEGNTNERFARFFSFFEASRSDEIITMKRKT